MRGALLIGSMLLLSACESSARKDEPAPDRSGPPGAASLDELRDRGIEALRAGDPDAYLELMGSPAFMMKHCPAEPDYAGLAEGGAVAARAEQRLRVRTAVATCADALDWSRAVLEDRSGGEPKSTTMSCSDAAQEFEDLLSDYQVGKQTWRIKVANDVYLVGGRYVVLDLPTCVERDD